jgi:hypothetical protein
MFNNPFRPLENKKGRTIHSVGVIRGVAKVMDNKEFAKELEKL